MNQGKTVEWGALVIYLMPSVIRLSNFYLTKAENKLHMQVRRQNINLNPELFLNKSIGIFVKLEMGENSEK